MAENGLFRLAEKSSQLWFKHDLRAQALSQTVKLADAKSQDYDTVFYGGGYGPMGPRRKPSIHRTTRVFLQFGQADRPWSAILPAYQDAQLVKGKHVIGLTNGEEEEMHLTRVVPFLVEDELIAGSHLCEEGGLAFVRIQ